MFWAVTVPLNMLNVKAMVYRGPLSHKGPLSHTSTYIAAPHEMISRRDHGNAQTTDIPPVYICLLCLIITHHSFMHPYWSVFNEKAKKI